MHAAAGSPTTAMLITMEATSRAHTAHRGTRSAAERPCSLLLVTVLGGSEVVEFRGRRLSLKPVAVRPDSCSP